MLSKNTIFLHTLLLTTVLADVAIFAKQQNKTEEIKQLSQHTTKEQLETFEGFMGNLPSLLADLSNNEIAFLLNTLAAQFFLFELMEKEFNRKNVDQAQLESMMQGFQNALKTLEAQSTQKTKDLYESIQRAIASIVPQEVAEKIQSLQEEMQEIYTKAKDKNDSKLKDKMLELQSKLMKEFFTFQSITSLAMVEIYTKVYHVTAKKNKNLLLRRFNEHGIIPLTKRKDEVTHPDKAAALIKFFLEQTEAIAQQNVQ